ncbi:MAG: DUF6152 family protein [Woeseiaceae bacterium]|nr:DUF6152 family protein [Woeseiaceae bacterium]
MRKILPFLALPLLPVDPAAAHHAFAADYEPGNEGEVEGVITEVIYKNPHARYYLEVTGEAGDKQLWDLQTMNLMMLGRVGWKKDTLKVGDKVKVEGILGRNNTRRMSINIVTFEDGRVLSPQRGIRESTAELYTRGQAGDSGSGTFDSLASNISPGLYKLDERHSYLAFSYSHLGLSNSQLQFADFTASLDLNGNDMGQSAVDIRIDASSVVSAAPGLDDDLRGPDFFDVENYPEITFRSTSYQETSESTGRLTGDLNVRGVTRPVMLDVTINSAAMSPLNRKEMIGFSASGSLNRSDFGLTGYPATVSDEVSFEVQVEFEKVR